MAGVMVTAALITIVIAAFNFLSIAGPGTNAVFLNVAVNSDDINDRLTSILKGLQLFVDDPVFGAGLGAFRNEHIFLHSDQPLLIHSTYVWLLAELGLVGFLAFGVPPILALVEEARRGCSDTGGRLLTLCLVGFGVVSFAADMVYQRTFWLLFGAALITKAA
jgi:O-antigen ligase